MDQPPVLHDPDEVDQLDLSPFLMDVVDYTRDRVAKRIKEVPASGLSALTTIQKRPASIANVLRKENGVSLIGTIKSQKLDNTTIMPSETYNPVELAREFVQAGARAVSVTTDPRYYRGDLHHLTLISGEVDVPTIRQDFVFDEYQVIESRAAGADGITLIASMLGPQRLRNLVSLTQRLRMTEIVVITNQEELDRALDLDPRVIGINNRDWHNFEIDLSRTLELSQQIPRHIVVVSLGGIQNAEDLSMIANARVDAVQIGTHLLESEDYETAVEELFSLIDTDPADPWEKL